jgi:hypothetical protein
MSSRYLRLTRLLLAAFFVSVVSACDEDSSGLSGGATGIAGQTNEAVDSVIAQFFDDNEALNSLDGLGGFITAITGQPSIAPSALAPADDGWRSSRTAGRTYRELMSMLAARGLEAEVEANIPSALLGATCVWDPTLNQGDGAYRDEPGLTGAPTNGIRFRLYTVDAGTLRPVVPLDDIGFIDIVDLSSDPDFDVDIAAVVGGETLLDYSVTGTYNSSTSAYSLSMLGFVSDGVDQINFTWGAAADATSFSNSFQVDLGPVTVSLDQDYTAPVINTTVTITDESTDDNLEIVLGLDEETGGTTQGSGIWFNGEQVAEFAGTNFQIQLLPVGNALSEQDLVQLFTTLNALDDLFVALDELFFFGVAVSGGFAF